MTQQHGDEHPIPFINPDVCNGCGWCVVVCPTHALQVKSRHAIVANPDACLYSGHCERICPTHAISRPFQIIFNPPKDV